jgi:multidrug efflux pump subunit AcrA (membrane-fusion protein)
MSLKNNLIKKIKKACLLTLFLFIACQPEQETLSPIRQSITESVYASGLVKSKNQYQVFATVSGIVEEVLVEEGNPVEIGTPLLTIANDAQQLMASNAKLTADFNALSINRGKLEEAQLFVDLTKKQMENDSSMLNRQQNLWQQNIGSKIELEQKELALARAKNNYASAKEKLSDLKRQLKYFAQQAKNNQLISTNNSNDYVVKSKIAGMVYQMNVAKGEIISPQIPIATLGNANQYLLEMQIDEYDIVSIKLDMPVLVVLNSYKDSVFDAVVTKINPMMNVQSKTFTVEAQFTRPPQILYPNISFEANVVVSSKEKALLIPRNYLVNDTIVLNKNGEELSVKTGLKDYQMVEILDGLKVTDELIQPEP